MALGRIVFAKELPAEGKHPMTTSETQLADLIRRCGYTATYEPKFVRFLLVDDSTGETYLKGVQADFYIPELDLYVELTSKRLCARKQAQVRLMVAVGLHMLLIDGHMWSNVSEDLRLLQELLIAASPTILALSEAAA